VILVLLLLFVLAIFLFSGLAFFVTKFFIIRLLLLPLLAAIGFFVFWRHMDTQSDEQQAPFSDH
jgi:hypothetical protein